MLIHLVVTRKEKKRKKTSISGSQNTGEQILELVREQMTHTCLYASKNDVIFEMYRSVFFSENYSLIKQRYDARN